jgi:hypothetical protein
LADSAPLAGAAAANALYQRLRFFGTPIFTRVMSRNQLPPFVIPVPLPDIKETLQTFIIRPNTPLASDYMLIEDNEPRYMSYAGVRVRNATTALMLSQFIFSGNREQGISFLHRFSHYGKIYSYIENLRDATAEEMRALNFDYGLWYGTLPHAQHQYFPAVRFLYFILRQKIRMSKLARETLLSTGVKYISNASEQDDDESYWSAATNYQDPALIRIEYINSRGNNWLGKTAAFIRHQLVYIDIDEFERSYPEWCRLQALRTPLESLRDPNELPFVLADEQ